ncbi:MAG: F0F1 ATP synthase subunit B [Candidatus Omnitrophota bacterium]
MTPDSALEHVSGAAEHAPGVFTPDVMMAVLTWVTFFALLLVLYKFAWKPILNALESREELIRRSVENAEKANRQLADIEKSRDEIIAQAHEKAKDVVDQARKAAIEAAGVIQQKTRDDAHIILENARREINAEKEKAQAELKSTSAHIAVQLAEKLINENLDSEKNQKIVRDFIKDI